MLTIEDAIGDPRTRRQFLAGAAAVGVLVLAGCGGDDGPTASSTRSVEDAFGPTDVPDRPRRVIADSVSTYAHLVSLGITPIAVAIPLGISPDYIGPDAATMTNVVADDGWTIDMEEALTMSPDLIVAVGADYNQENCDRYREGVSTYCFTETYTSGTDQDIKETLVDLAVALGREDEAAAAIAAYDERVRALRARVQASSAKDWKVGIVRFDAAGFVGIRREHAGNAILTALGLSEPDWPAADHDGYLVLSMETLGLLDEADLLLINTDDDVVLGEVAAMQSPLWSQLAVVREDRIELVGAWNGGDLPQLNRMLDDLERALLG